MQESDRARDAPAPGARTLLVIDDEPEWAAVVAEVAGRAGYRVIATSRPSDFDSLYSPDIDVIVLDLWMPGIDGIEIIRRLAARRSQARLILVSGFDQRVLDAARTLARSHGLDVAGSLAKPVRLAQLAALLGDDRPAAAGRPESPLAVTVAALQQAFVDDQIVVHFQPQVALRTSQVVGVEALVRWREPDGTLIPPDRFVQVAEAYNLAQALTWRVLEKVAAEAAVFAGYPQLSISVNLPPAALTDVTFPDRVVDHLAGLPLPPGALHFEVTETTVVRELTSALDILTRLRLKGFALAIDDFGTGYASLAQLRQLPFSQLKIDRSFVVRMDHDPASRAIVQHCVTLGHDLGMTVVAEGAETRETWLALQEVGCDVVQGFFVLKPAAAQEVVDWIGGFNRLTP